AGLFVVQGATDLAAWTSDRHRLPRATHPVFGEVDRRTRWIPQENMAEYHQILKSSSSVLLVDWISTKVPRSLLEAGFRVYGSSPGGYSKAELLPEAPQDEHLSVFPPEDQQSGFLVFRRLAAAPTDVDIVY